MITLDALRKQYGATVAVDGLTLEVHPGRVTAFLGPNGAGKSTTLRMLVDLDRPTSGTARIDGRRYRDLSEPLRVVGALLDAGAPHPGRTGLAHLRIAARTHGIDERRVHEVLDVVGLTSAARRRVKGYSLGMRQRLGIAAALLGDPQVLLLDEPVNGLDVDGVRWIRDLLRGFADEGRTVLVSSHLMGEVEQIADHVLVLGRGRLIADAPLEDLLRAAGRRVRVRGRGVEAVVPLVGRRGRVVRVDDGEIEVEGLREEELGELAHDAGVVVHHLAEVGTTLEQAYVGLTEGAVEYAGPAAGGAR